MGGLAMSYSASEPQTANASIPLSEEAKKWRQRFWLSVSAKSPLVGEWVTFDRFYLGDQWDLRRPTWRPDPVVNLIFRIVDELGSQLAQYDPEPILLPQKPGDTAAAEMFKDVTSWWWERQKMHSAMDEVIRTMLLLGTSIVKVAWDPTLTGGEDRAEYIPGADGTQEQVPGSLWKGEVTAQVVDPANFYIDPGAYELQDAAWCGTMTPKPVDYVKQRYPKYAALIRPEYSFNLSEIYYRPSTFQAFQASLGPTGGGYVEVFEGWEKTGGKDGLVRVVMINNIVVERKTNFYAHGLYPYVRFVDNNVRKSFWGMGEAKLMFNLQKLINKLMELIAMNGLLTANSQRVILASSMIDPKTVTNEPGKNYVSNIANPIQPLVAPQVPQYVFELLNMAKSDATDVVGLFVAPPIGIRAAAAIIALLEKAAARVKHKMDNIIEGQKEIVNLLIKQYQEFGQEARIARISDENAEGGVKFFSFRASDYATAEFDVRIDSGQGQPLSKAILAEMAQQALQLQGPDGKPALRASEYLTAIDFPYPDAIARLRKEENAADVAAQTPQMPGQPPGQPGQIPAAPPHGGPGSPAMADARANLPPFAQSSSVKPKMLQAIDQALGMGP